MGHLLLLTGSIIPRAKSTADSVLSFMNVMPLQFDDIRCVLEDAGHLFQQIARPRAKSKRKGPSPSPPGQIQSLVNFFQFVRRRLRALFLWRYEFSCIIWCDPVSQFVADQQRMPAGCLKSTSAICI
jgi:hypothetical protein